MKGANIIKITLIAVGVVIILVIIVALISINNIMKNSKKGVAITTQKTSYKGGEDMNLKIKNYFTERIYLSSCYP
jgi:type II secretory pathway pseudopilin PulG